MPPLPQIEVRYPQQLYIDQPDIIELFVPTQNSQLIKALNFVENRVQLKYTDKMLEVNKYRKHNFTEVSEFGVSLNIPEKLQSYFTLPNSIVVHRRSE